MSVTAKVRVNSVTPCESGTADARVVDQVAVTIGTHYREGDNEINQEWAKYTPALSLTMTVKPEVAEAFPVGQAFLLTFTPED